MPARSRSNNLPPQGRLHTLRETMLKVQSMLRCTQAKFSPQSTDDDWEEARAQAEAQVHQGLDQLQCRWDAFRQLHKTSNAGDEHRSEAMGRSVELIRSHLRHLVDWRGMGMWRGYATQVRTLGLRVGYTPSLTTRQPRSH